jgi:hypothetical protein
MIHTILDLLIHAQSVTLNGKEIEVWSRPVNGQPDHPVVQLTATGSGDLLAALTERSVAQAQYDANEQTLAFAGEEDVPVTLVLKLVPAADKMSYVLIQEGGASDELYIHAHESMEDAEADRVECEENGAYRTSDILEIPSALADYPGFYEQAEAVLRLKSTLGFPSSAE